MSELKRVLKLAEGTGFEQVEAKFVARYVTGLIALNSNPDTVINSLTEMIEWAQTIRCAIRRDRQDHVAQASFLNPKEP